MLAGCGDQNTKNREEATEQLIQQEQAKKLKQLKKVKPGETRPPGSTP
jgi:hypothetical protein